MSARVLHTLEAAAAALGGRRPEYYRRLAKAGAIPARRIGGKWFFTDADLDAALDYFMNDFNAAEPAPEPEQPAADNVRQLAFSATTKRRVATG